MKKTYVSNWRRLSHKHQSITQVQQFLVAFGLLDGVAPTTLAFMHGYTKKEKHRVLWHVDRYHRLWKREGLYNTGVEEMLMSKMRDVGYNTYSEYLLSKYWESFKLRYFTEHKNRCFVCGKTHCQLHHITYERLGCELFQDVIPLCGGCHCHVHKLVKNQRIRLDEAHHVVKKEFLKRSSSKKNDVVINWRKLLNKSSHQTISELQDLLQEYGLLDGVKATAKAFRLGYARQCGEQVQWRKKICLTMFKDGGCWRRESKYNNKKEKRRAAKRQLNDSRQCSNRS